MKNRILYTIFFVATALLWSSCSEDDFSKDYDINYPVAIITATSVDNPYVEDEVTLTGENFQTATSITIGAYRFEIVSVGENGTTAVIKVPRAVEAGALSVTNKYGRVFESEVKLYPQFYEAVVTGWPTQIQLGRTFTLEGDNMDMISEVKVNGTVVSTSGAPTAGAATYSVKGLDVAIGDEVTIEVTPKAGAKQTVEGVKIIKPADTYVPKSTLMVVDFNTAYTVENGDAFGECTAFEDEGLLGNAFRVTAPVGNGWNGTYCKIYGDNGGNGFDLSAYTNPCITMLINTFGIEGYVQPITYDATNGEQDRHLEGKFGYGDDYKSKTNGWEWRSYSLAELGFPVSNGYIEKIGIQFRGGNISEEAFDVAVNSVMITDGPMNPAVVWDCEEPVSEMGKFVLKNTGEGGLQGVSEGKKFASYTMDITGGWNWDTECIMDVPALDEKLYTNGIWVNMLINTGNNLGYCQLEFGQGGSGLDWFNFTQDQGYGDDYKFVPTNNQWEWRSVRIDPEGMKLDISQPFYIKLGATTGNWDSGTYELNFDYVVFTATPMDPTLNTNDFK